MVGAAVPVDVVVGEVGHDGNTRAEGVCRLSPPASHQSMALDTSRTATDGASLDSV